MNHSKFPKNLVVKLLQLCNSVLSGSHFACVATLNCRGLQQSCGIFIQISQMEHASGHGSACAFNTLAVRLTKKASLVVPTFAHCPIQQAFQAPWMHAMTEKQLPIGLWGSKSLSVFAICEIANGSAADDMTNKSHGISKNVSPQVANPPKSVSVDPRKSNSTMNIICTAVKLVCNQNLQSDLSLFPSAFSEL